MKMNYYSDLTFCKQVFMSVSLGCSAAVMSQRSIKHKPHNGFFPPNPFEFRKRQPVLICLLKRKVSRLEDIGCHSLDIFNQSTLIGHAVGF